MEKLDEYFSPKKNVVYEIFQFRQAKQNIGETTDLFATRLCQLFAHCESHDLDQEIKAAIIQNFRSKHLRRYALREDKVTLKDFLQNPERSNIANDKQKGLKKCWHRRLFKTNGRSKLCKSAEFATKWTTMSQLWINMASS